MSTAKAWFTSDLHFRHRKVAEIRGFSSPDEHDDHIVLEWNKRVKPGDIVWVCGDAGVGKTAEVLAQVDRLAGRKQLITGNHDAPWPGHRDSWKHQRQWLKVFESVQAFGKSHVGPYPVIMSHFPYEGDHTPEDREKQWRLRDEGEILVHGHLHTRLQVTGFQQVHVGLDAHRLRPVSAAILTKIIAGAVSSGWKLSGFDDGNEYEEDDGPRSAAAVAQ